MFDLFITILANLCIAVGAALTLIGAIGMVRMPDFFTRLHPAGIKDAMGIPLVIIGLIIISGSAIIALKLVLLLLFLLFTNPTASHALAKSALLDRSIGTKKIVDPSTSTSTEAKRRKT